MAKWKLREYLNQHKLSAYSLVQEAELAPNTVYALARGDQKRIDLGVLDKVMAALDNLTGEQVTYDDLLERDPAEDDVLVDDELRARIERFENGEAKLIPWKQVKAEQRAKREL
jgi:DNA-binding Xre family transcriptional regulator